MFDSFPLARYFTRIGYHGPAEPTLEVLRQLHLLHPQAIPFENIDAYSGLGVSLDLARIADKMLARGRGGYCFEHNRLFQAVLEQLGFRVTPLIARVRWQVPADVRTGLTHMLLRVDLDGRSWLVDVAFGSTTQTAPLEFLLNVPQETPHGVFRIAPVGPDEFSLEFQTAKGWSTVYQYGLRPAPAVDFEIGNWYTSSHPQSVFLSDLIISRTAPGLRELLVNDVLTLRGQHGRAAETRRYDDAQAWADCLRERFGLDLPPGEAAALFERAAASGRQAAAGELTAG